MTAPEAGWEQAVETGDSRMPVSYTHLAADIIKIAMVRVSERLQKEGCQARLTMQVHDELVLEVPVDELEKVEELLRYEMEHAVAFQLPLTVEVHSGASLYDTK